MSSTLKREDIIAVVLAEHDVLGPRTLASTICEELDKYLPAPQSQPTELELHRAGYAAFQAAGFGSPEELFAACSLQDDQIYLLQTKLALCIKNRDEEIDDLQSRLAAAEKDAARYQWLRDKSVSPHSFYLSVPVEFKDDRFSPAEVDTEIDAAISACSQVGGVE